MRIATWNVESIKQRLENLPVWLKERAPDIVCFQETKTVDENFPREIFEGLGYNVAVHGQKTFNGVAILSKLPFDEVTPRLPGDDEAIADPPGVEPRAPPVQHGAAIELGQALQPVLVALFDRGAGGREQHGGDLAAGRHLGALPPR